MSRLRRSTIRTRQSIIRNPDPVRDSPSVSGPNTWAPPPAIAQNLARLSDSPMVPEHASPAKQSAASSTHFKSFIGDFLAGAAGKQASAPETSTSSTVSKFQFKMASAAPDNPSPLGGKRLLNDSVEVGENELLIDDEEDEDDIPQPPPQDQEDARRTSVIDGDAYDLTKSPFRTQTNPIPSPSPRAPKVSRVSSSPNPPPVASIHVIDSDEMPPPRMMVDELKDFRFDDSQMPTTAAVLSEPKKSFTQDIVTGFLNTQSDFFETQMGKMVEQDCLFPARREPVKKFQSIGTMTDPVEVQIRQPMADRIGQQRESLRAMVNSLNRANTAIVRFMGQIEKVCGKTSKSSAFMRNGF